MQAYAVVSIEFFPLGSMDTVGLRYLYDLKLQSKSNLDQVQRKVIDKNVT